MTNPKTVDLYYDPFDRLLSKVFTPRRMAAIEPLTRQFCLRALDPLAEKDGFDVIADLGALIPMRTIGYLLGIPEQGQQLYATPRTTQSTSGRGSTWSPTVRSSSRINCSPTTSTGGPSTRPTT